MDLYLYDYALNGSFSLSVIRPRRVLGLLRGESILGRFDFEISAWTGRDSWPSRAVDVVRTSVNAFESLLPWSGRWSALLVPGMIDSTCARWRRAK